MGAVAGYIEVFNVLRALRIWPLLYAVSEEQA
jgi:hypothetical protein